MKRGFTLIELLAIMVVLGMIAVIAIPNIQTAFSKSKQNLLENQIKSIENVARSWGVKNTNKLDDCYVLTLDELKRLGYLENQDVINPETKEELDGCIKITFDESINQYKYTYTESTLCSCNN
ncbi:MAG: type II secretion system protein [Firmicutes bacterium]|nr:type II secretion system protein [Bacillota bacterium]